jgi:hypothetical protein
LSESQINHVQLVVIALFAGSLLLAFTLRRLRHNRPDLHIGRPIWTAFAVRIFAAFLVSGTSIASQLRGGDENTFMAHARELLSWSFLSTGTTHAFTHQIYVFLFSLNYRISSDAPDMMARVEVIALAVIGLALLAAAVYELAGQRAATITAWVLALEPANIFFSGILHKEPFMLLAEGMVAYGGAVLWKRGTVTALIPMVLGALLAMATRPYAGWFLAMAAAVITLHAGFRRKTSPATSFALIGLVLAVAAVFGPTVWNASSKKSLGALQYSQNANATNSAANLSLERVDYSTRGKIIVNLPQRMLDIATKPYPWQIGNASQQLGVLGTSFLALALYFLVTTLMRNGRGIMKRAGPLIYLFFFLYVAYALSAGNAGTAFRYRTHLVALLVAAICVLRETEQAAPEPVRATPGSTRAQVPPIYAQRQPT